MLVQTQARACGIIAKGQSDLTGIICGKCSWRLCKQKLQAALQDKPLSNQYKPDFCNLQATPQRKRRDTQGALSNARLNHPYTYSLQPPC